MNKEIAAIYFAGLLQGIVLVAFPAASTILTSPEAFGFSSTEYGSLFIPQTLLSIAAAALNPLFSRRWGSKSVFLAGLLANFFAMGLLALSVLTVKTAYPMLLAATGCLGLGFGLVVPTVNSMAALLYPARVDAIILVLNALLGVGTALAPIFIAFFSALGFWWGLPALLVVLLILLFFFSYPRSLPGGKIPFSLSGGEPLQFVVRFWLFAAFATLYGVIETLNGNWVSLYMKTELHAQLTTQSLALAAFWGMVTLGRVFFAMAGKIFPPRWAFQVLPFVAAVAFLFVAAVLPGGRYLGVAAFGLTGFGCSALLPLAISFGTKQLPTMSSAVPGLVVSFYLLGYGIASFGVGPLEDLFHIGLRDIYACGAVAAVLLGGLALTIMQTKKRI